MTPGDSLLFRALMPVVVGVVLLGCGSALPTVDGVPLPDRAHPVPPTPGARSAGGMNAGELLQASDAAMRAVEFVVVEGGHLVDDPFVPSWSAQVSPLTAWTRPREDPGSFMVVAWISDRMSGGFWFARIAPLYASSLRVTAAQDVRILGEATIEGRDAWVIWYRFTSPSVEEPFEIWTTEWIDQEDLLLLQQSSDSFDPWGSNERSVLRPSYEAGRREETSPR